MAYRNIVILTGAGISAESGVPTFRAEDGLWAGRKVEEVATAAALMRDPEGVNAFYNERWQQLETVKPNPAHEALARLENEFDGDLFVITQNVDNLHSRAGQRNLLHMHGELVKISCRACGAVSPRNAPVTTLMSCPRCDVPGGLRPHIVLFQEMPLELDRIGKALKGCDLFVSIGTSGVVYPAAGFVEDVRRYGTAHTIEINPAETDIAPMFHEHRRGPAGIEVPKWVDEVLN